MIVLCETRFLSVLQCHHSIRVIIMAALLPVLIFYLPFFRLCTEASLLYNTIMQKSFPEQIIDEIHKIVNLKGKKVQETDFINI